MKQDRDIHSSGLWIKLGLFTAVMVVMNSMIGSGVFKKAAPMALQLNSAYWILLCWVIAGMITFFGALTNAEVASLIAAPGGQYVYFREMYGKFFSFLFGWSCFAVIQTASIASIAYVFSQSVHHLLPLPHLPESLEKICLLGIFYPLDNLGVKLVAIFTILFLTYANYCGVVFGGWITNIFTILKVLGITLIIVLGLFLGDGVIVRIHPLNHLQASSSLGIFGAMFAAMLSAFWAYDGWNNVGFLGGEIKEPKTNIPIALGLGVGAVMIIYLLINFVYLYLIPIPEILKIAQDKNTIVGIYAAQLFLGQWGAFFIATLILISTFGTTNGCIFTSSRIYFAMARDGIFFQSMKKCHPQFRTPSTALWFQGIWASLLVMSGTFDQLTDMLIFAAFIFYGSAALGVFVLRHKMKDQVRLYKVPLYPIIPGMFALFSITLVIVTIIQNPRDAGMGLVLILLGIPFYLFWNRNSQK